MGRTCETQTHGQWAVQLHTSRQTDLIKDSGHDVLVKDGDVLGAVGDQCGSQGVQNGQSAGHQPVLLQPDLSGRLVGSETTMSGFMMEEQHSKSGHVTIKQNVS